MENKLMIAAAKLLHKKELEGFYDLVDAFDGKYVPRGDRFDWNAVWFWGRKRWPGRVWPRIEYVVREGEEIKESDWSE